MSQPGLPIFAARYAMPVDQRVETSAFQRGHKLISENNIVPRIGDENLCLTRCARVGHMERLAQGAAAERDSRPWVLLRLCYNIRRLTERQMQIKPERFESTCMNS